MLRKAGPTPAPADGWSKPLDMLWWPSCPRRAAVHRVASLPAVLPPRQQSPRASISRERQCSATQLLGNAGKRFDAAIHCSDKANSFPAPAVQTRPLIHGAAGPRGAPAPAPLVPARMVRTLCCCKHLINSPAFKEVKPRRNVPPVTNHTVLVPPINASGKSTLPQAQNAFLP